MRESGGVAAAAGALVCRAAAGEGEGKDAEKKMDSEGWEQRRRQAGKLCKT